MLKIRKADERGHANWGWLDTHHTFSFADYHDREHMGFRALRVINDDRIAAGAGFPDHPHRDMEIITYVLGGAVAHRDSMGTGSVIRAGDVQRMSAGTGVTHSEYNHSKSEPLHLLQIWLLPEQRGLEPSYEQKTFPDQERRGALRLVASPDGADGSITVHQGVKLYSTLLAPGDRVEYPLAANRHAWIQVAEGAITVNGELLDTGDGAAISGATILKLEGEQDANVLLFDLA